jgi:hypothetical protein
MQIANILQVLAMSDDKDPKAQDLYSKFRHVGAAFVFYTAEKAN